MIKAVVFDMYETLITLFESPLYFGTQMAEDAGITEEHFQSVWRSAERDRTIGKISLEELLEKILKLIEWKLGFLSSAESKIVDTDEVSSKKWFKQDEYLELLRTNGTKDGVSMLAILYALQFYK